MKGISNLSRPSRRAYDFFKNTQHFEHLLIADSSLAVLNEIDELTGFCVPDLLADGGEGYLRYELCFAVAGVSDDPLSAFKNGMANGQYLGLPRVLPSARFFDCIVENGCISDWLVKIMSADMAKFTMNASEALKLIDNNDDRFRKYLKVFPKDFFEASIREPLKQRLQTEV